MQKTGKIISGILAVGIGVVFVHKAISELYSGRKRGKNVYSDEEILESIRKTTKIEIEAEENESQIEYHTEEAIEKFTKLILMELKRALYGEDSDLVKETIKEVVSRLDLKEANVEEKIIGKYEINTATLTFLLDTVDLEEIEELKTWMKESKVKVLQGEFQVYLDKSLVEVNMDNTKVTNKIPKELYYELLSKILCDLRHEVKLRKEKFYAEGNTVMTTKDRDQILNSIDGVQVRENVFKEFGIKSNLPAVEVLKNCFDAYSIDLNFKMKV